MDRTGAPRRCDEAVLQLPRPVPMLLSLNIKKTNYIIFGSNKINDIPVTISREPITRVSETKFLGVIIQANLKWNAHIKVIQIFKAIGIISKAKYLLSNKHLKQLYQTLIEP